MTVIMAMEHSEDSEMQYKHLGPKLGSAYRQWVVQGRGIFAQTLWLATLGDEGMTAEQVAADRDLPVEAVLEAIDYCERNQDLLQREREEDDADMLAKGYIRALPQLNGQPDT
jgi:uncharacterized protein (DUF433 family)